MLEFIVSLVLGWNLVTFTSPGQLDDPCIEAIWHWRTEEQRWDLWVAPPWMLQETGAQAGELPAKGKVYWVYCE